MFKISRNWLTDNPDINIRKGSGTFLNDHFALFKCFSFENITQDRCQFQKVANYIKHEQKIPISCIDVSSRVIDFDRKCLILSARFMSRYIRYKC